MCETDVNRYNLVEESWIPVADTGLVSLRQIFSDMSLRSLGGNPLQKIAIIKLLLAIVQAAWTPKDENEWEVVGRAGMVRKTLEYLECKKDLFWLFGEKPFLQIPPINIAAKQAYGALQPYIATGNTTVLLQSQVEKKLTDAEKAQLLVVLMGFATGGKKTDNTVVLSSGYTGKTNDKGKASTGKPGPALGFLGYQHNFLQSADITATLWHNVLTKEALMQIPVFKYGVGTAPWEQMPTGEDCKNAIQLKNSYMGRLIHFNRFVLLKDDYLHYTEGVYHLSYKDGFFDLSIAVDNSGDPKALWVDPEKRPWRQLTALLSFLNSTTTNGFDCLQLRICLPRARKHESAIGIWSGGLKVKNNAGEQYVSGMDDFVESEVNLVSKYIGAEWFKLLENEVAMVDDLAKNVYSAVNGYYRKLKMDGKKSANKAVNNFWQLCERQSQKLVDACYDVTGESIKNTRRIIAGFAERVYNTSCHSVTARQLDAWAANKPYLKKYLNETKNQ